MNASLPLTRRGFGCSIAAASTLAALPGLAAASAAPVVAFHMDTPYVDWTGAAEPYRPPEGLRAGDGMAALADHELQGLHGWA